MSLLGMLDRNVTVLKNVTNDFLLFATLARAVKVSPAPSDRRWPEHQWILGHRGARTLAPENTLSAFRLAMEHGADGVEFDVLLSRDGIPVVIHDETLERTTNGHGKVSDTDQKHLADLDATKLIPGYPKEGVPTLLEALSVMPDGALVNVELKGSGRFTNAYFVERALKDIEVHQDRLRILVSSFDSDLLKRLRKSGVSFLIALLLSKRDKHFRHSLANFSAVKPDALNVSPDLANPITRFLARRAHLRLGVWTINNRVLAKRLHKAGIDGIFTDRVQEIVGALRKPANRRI